MRAVVIVNRKGGMAAASTQPLEEQLATAFVEAGIDADIRIPPHDRLPEAIEEAAGEAGFDLLVAAGGDGTVSCAAGAAIRHGRTLGVLPLGTLNHLARDVGIPSDLAGAVGVIAAGHVGTIDVGEVNGHVFVNNSSVGLYPLMVREREAQQRRLGRSKRFAMLVASLRVLRHFGRRRLVIRIAGREHPIETPLLFVGNNCYETSLFALGRRPRLDAEELCIYALLARTRRQLIGIAMRRLIGRLDQARDFIKVDAVEEAEIDSSRPWLSVAADGEVMSLEAPLCFRSRPAALKLLMPAPERKASRGGVKGSVPMIRNHRDRP